MCVGRREDEGACIEHVSVCTFKTATLLFILAMVHFPRMHLKDDFALAQRADTVYESPGIVVSAKKCGSAFEHEIWGGKPDGKAGFRLGTPSIVDACHGDGGRAWTLRA